MGVTADGERGFLVWTVVQVTRCECCKRRQRQMLRCVHYPSKGGRVAIPCSEGGSGREIMPALPPTEVGPEPAGLAQRPRPQHHPRPGSRTRVSEKNGRAVRMKESAAGSKAKTVQLADFKWLVCPLDAQLEKRLPSEDVCGGRDKLEPPRPSPLPSAGTRAAGGPPWQGRGQDHRRHSARSHGHHRAPGLPKACPSLTGADTPA